MIADRSTQAPASLRQLANPNQFPAVIAIGEQGQRPGATPPDRFAQRTVLRFALGMAAVGIDVSEALTDTAGRLHFRTDEES